MNSPSGPGILGSPRDRLIIGRITARKPRFEGTELFVQRNGRAIDSMSSVSFTALRLVLGFGFRL